MMGGAIPEVKNVDDNV